MKAVLCLLAVAACVASGWRFPPTKSNRFLSAAGTDDLDYEVSSAQALAKAGLPYAQPQHEYRFEYSVQVSAGFAPWVSAQNAAQRMHCDVRVQYQSERSGVLRVEKCWMGKLNGVLNTQKIESPETFEPTSIPEERMAELRRPCQFSFADNTIERLHFDKTEAIWARNIKKAILSLAQLNVRKATAFENTEPSTLNRQTRMFTVEEASLEGICQTTYTMNRVSDLEVNVTKAVNFDQCRELADIAYGMHGEQQQERILKEQQSLAQKKEQVDGVEQQPQAYDQPIPTEKLDRSTVQRYALVKLDNGKYVLRTVELVSQYSIRNLRSESDMANQIVVMSRLQLVGAEKKKIEKPVEQLEDEESILYNSRVEVEEKRFYMYGDEEFPKSVFVTENKQNEPKLAEKIQQFVAKFAHELQKPKKDETKLQLFAEVERQLDHVRRLSYESLKQLEERLDGKQKEIFYDLCAAAATRNPIALLAQRLPEMKAPQAVKILKALSGNLITPSDRIAQLVLDACKKINKDEHTATEQSCWLTFSSIVGQVARQSRFAQLSRVNHPTKLDEQKIQQKLSQFEKELSDKFEQATTEYERLLAIKCIGNAGLTSQMPLLEKIIRDNVEQPLIRTWAVDALRRQRFFEPLKIQKILLPIFVDTKQPAQVRMAAVSMLVSTLPAGPNGAKALLDQIVFTMTQERSEQVRGFTYSLMKAYSKSPLAAEQEIAQHLKNALKIADIAEEEQLKRASRHIRIPIYSEQAQEGVFVGMQAAFAPHSIIPTHLAAYLDSMLNGFVDKHTLYVSVCQQNVGEWLREIYTQIMQEQRQSPITRAQRSQNPRSQVRQILQGLKLVKRSHLPAKPFVLLNVRVKDMDQVVLPITDTMLKRYAANIAEMQSELAQVFAVDRQSLAVFQNKQLSMPSSAGFSIRMQNIVPMLSDVQMKIKLQSDLKIKQYAMAEFEIKKAQIHVAHQQYILVKCPLTDKHIGSETWRSGEVQTPERTQFRAKYSAKQGITFDLNWPAQETPLVAARTLPLTFIEGQSLRTVENQQLRRQQREIQTHYGSIELVGHVYRPLNFWEPKELLKSIMTAQNQIQVVLKSDKTTEFKAQLEGFVFQPVHIDEARPEPMQKFYAQQRYVSASSEESKEERQERVSEFMRSYAERVHSRGSNKAYKHELKVWAEKDGARAEAQLSAVCDSTLTACRVQFNAQRPTVTGYDRCDSTEWKLKAKFDHLSPEKMSRYDEETSSSSSEESKEAQQSKKAHDTFLGQFEAEWGSCKREDNKVQAQLAVRAQSAFPRRVRVFLNQYDVHAEYQLPHETQHAIQQWYELFKSYNYMKSRTEQRPGVSATATRKGSVQLRLRVEPVNRQYLNLTLQTPREVLRMEEFRMPRLFNNGRAPAWRTGMQQRRSYHSVKNVLSELANQARDKCIIDVEDKVHAFNDVIISAPLGRCYTLLASDCHHQPKDQEEYSGEERQFAIWAKKAPGIRGGKYLRINAKDEILAEPEWVGGTELRLKLTVNGKPVRPDHQEQHIPDYIHFNGDFLSVNLDLISVRFDGRVIELTVAEQITHHQCGVCGDYRADLPMLRNAQDESTENVAEFHRSYTLAEGEDCTPEELDSFYSRKQGQFRVQARTEHRRERVSQRYTNYWDSEEWEQSEEEQEEQTKEFNKEQKKERKFLAASSLYNNDEYDEGFGDYEDERMVQSFNSKKQQEQRRYQLEESSESDEQEETEYERKQKYEQKPIKKIKLAEYKHKLCFSLKPQPTCPPRTYADETGLKAQKVQYACMDRHSTEARQLLREARRRVGQDLEELAQRFQIEVQPSFVETQELPERCHRL